MSDTQTERNQLAAGDHEHDQQLQLQRRRLVPHEWHQEPDEPGPWDEWRDTGEAGA